MRSSTPAAAFPTNNNDSGQTVFVLDVPVNATGDEALGGVISDETEVKEVVVDSDEQDFEFNVRLSGSDLFSAEQSPGKGVESFTPDQNTRDGGSTYSPIVLNVSSASGEPGATADFYVKVKHRS